ncbi:hypothetical protein HWV62_1434, partial [Athelia sp. TMB]
MTMVCKIPDMESQRTYAPEVTLRAFEAGGGQGYLHILRTLLVSHSLNNFMRLENPELESMLGIESAVDAGAQLPTGPMLFVRKWDESLVPLKSSKDKLTPEDMAALKRAVSHLISLIKCRENKKERKTAQSICNRRRKLEVELSNGPFKSRYNTVTSSDEACSDCQIADWKSGKPRHKSLCGRREASLDA